MNQPLDELVLGSVTLVSYPDRIEIFINDTLGLVKPYIYFRTPDLRMSLLTKVSKKGQKRV